MTGDTIKQFSKCSLAIKQDEVENILGKNVHVS